jgi:hypothetical protein
MGFFIYLCALGIPMSCVLKIADGGEWAFSLDEVLLAGIDGATIGACATL